MKNNFSMEIQAPPDRVFSWLDESSKVMQWIEGYTEHEDLELKPEKVGSTFRQIYTENGKPMEFHGTVTAYEANRRVACNLTSKGFDIDVDYTLEDLGGSTRVTQDSEVTFKGFMKLLGFILGPLCKKAGEKKLCEDFGRLKKLCEQSDQSAVSA